MKRASTHVNIIWSKDSRAPQIVHPSSPFHFLSFIFVLVGSLFWLASHMNTFIFIGSLDLQIFSALLFFTPLKLSHLYSDLVVKCPFFSSFQVTRSSSSPKFMLESLAKSSSHSCTSSGPKVLAKSNYHCPSIMHSLTKLTVLIPAVINFFGKDQF